LSPPLPPELVLFSFVEAILASGYAGTRER
jgi:hypothetical protein